MRSIGGHLQSQGSGNDTVTGSEGFSYARRNMENTFMSGGVMSGISEAGPMPIHKQISMGDASSAFGDHRWATC